MRLHILPCRRRQGDDGRGQGGREVTGAMQAVPGDTLRRWFVWPTAVNPLRCDDSMSAAHQRFRDVMRRAGHHHANSHQGDQQQQTRQQRGSTEAFKADWK